MILKDEGHGITRRSLEFWQENKSRLGEPLSVYARKNGVYHEMVDDDGMSYPLEWNVMIIGTQDDILLSGCTCGYGGEGPNGTAKILAELGIPIETAREIMHNEIIMVNLRYLRHRTAR